MISFIKITLRLSLFLFLCYVLVCFQLSFPQTSDPTTIFNLKKESVWILQVPITHQMQNKHTQYIYSCTCCTIPCFVGCLTSNYEFIETSTSYILKYQRIVFFDDLFNCHSLTVKTPSKSRFWWTFSITCYVNVFSFINFPVNWTFCYTWRD